ncbi:hypothetical protein [Bacteriovorax sp. Seq25_V]|uniref:hypothetical protein n=1 Tax=Bacteriovorax sp. Seq25_V TaxID=1201288 RepID=UPI00038A4065|nr:hypothetical protein [Bacteriovorax sp. Seq25_V]EQC47201.1 hypothetical protein M900_0479 [Bacteriovorax sp. Seq25_V]
MKSDTVRVKISSTQRSSFNADQRDLSLKKNNEIAEVEKFFDKEKSLAKMTNFFDEVDAEIYKNLKSAFENEIIKDKVKKTFTFSQARVVRNKYYEPKTIRIIKEAGFFETAYFDIIYTQIKENASNNEVLERYCPRFEKLENMILCTDQLSFIADEGYLYPSVSFAKRGICESIDLVPSVNISFGLDKKFAPTLKYNPLDHIIVPLENIKFEESKTKFFYDKISFLDVSAKKDVIRCFPDIKIEGYLGVSGQSCAVDSDCMNGCCQRGMCSEQKCEKKIGEECLDSSFCAVGNNVLVMDLKLTKTKDGRIKCDSKFEGKKINNFCYKGFCRDIVDYVFQPSYSEKSLSECLETSQPESIKIYGSALREGEYEEIKYVP